MINASNIYVLDNYRSEQRRVKEASSDVMAMQESREMSAASLLSLSLANWLAYNFGSLSAGVTRERDPDLQSALYFAKARYFHYQGYCRYAEQILQSVEATAEGADLRVLATISRANTLFSMGELGRLGFVGDTDEAMLVDLPAAIKSCYHLLCGNIVYATGGDVSASQVHFRKVFHENNRSVLTRDLQQNLIALMAGHKSTAAVSDLQRYRDILDAFIEIAAGRYFAALVTTFT